MRYRVAHRRAAKRSGLTQVLELTKHMSRYRNPESELNIRRIDSIRVHGFQFHAQRRDIKITRLFSDSVSGSKQIARTRARLFRDRTVASLPDRTNSWGPRTHAANSNTSVMGISITESLNADGTMRVYIESTARAPGADKPINRKIRMKSDDDLSQLIQELREWRAQVLAGGVE